MAEFDKYAEDYDNLLRAPLRDQFATREFFQRRKWLLLEDWFKSHPLPNDPAWLDVGCGQGDLLSIGQHRFKRVEGCDPSEEMVRFSSHHHARHQTEPTKLPYGDAEFDFLTAVCIYHHVEADDRPALTKEVTRVLKPGGVACIIEHNPFNPATQWIVSRTPVDADAHLLTAGLSNRILSEAGLNPIGVEYFMYFPESIYAKIGGIEKALTLLPLGGQYAAFARKP